MSLPLGTVSNDSVVDFVSRGNCERLSNIRPSFADRVQVVEKTLTLDDIRGNLKDYRPWEYLGETMKRDDTGFIKGGYAAKREHQVPLTQ
jgi:hypothetical protein